MGKIFQSDTNSLNVIQGLCLVIVVTGSFMLDITWTNFFYSVIVFYLFSIVGLSITLHRYYSHKNFKFKNNFLRLLFTAIAVLSGRGSPLGWVYIHRLHHRYADTEQDPHGPVSMGFRLLGFKPMDASEKKMKAFLVKDMLNKEQLFIHNYYLAFIFAFMIVLFLIDFQVLYYFYAVPLLGIQFSQNCFNYFAHTFGYRNHNTKDDSTNNILLWPLIWGDAWHNNHHNNLAKFSTKENWWEFDPATIIAKAVRQ